jgi:hypothetical protein
MQTAARPVQTKRVQPAAERDIAALRPTEMRYAWCPYGDINLVGADGTINLLVQPAEIEENGQTVINPYHRVLPKGQLIPFPTFNAPELMPSADRTDSQGRAVLEKSFRAVTALDAAVAVLHRYAGWGFTIFDSLQGLDQDTAFRIFMVVQPLGYPLGSLINELSFGARARIDATEKLTFPDFPDYEIEPLRNETERAIALRLAEEMETGAQVAFDLATETLDTTETSMTTRFAGGSGKTGPDPLDKRLSAELGRELPKLIGKETAMPVNSALEKKVDFLVDEAASRKAQERIAELEAENARLRSPQIDGETMKEPIQAGIGTLRTDLTTGTATVSPNVLLEPLPVGTEVIVDGERGKVVAKPFGKYTVESADGTRSTHEREEVEVA